MKPLSALFLIFLLSNIPIHSQYPTYADPPGPENVLVVYNFNSSISKAIKNYYVSARGIPNSNIVALDQLQEDVYITYEGVTHNIKLKQGEENEKEIIEDQQAAWCPVYKHGWIYFIDRIATPIANKLKTTNENGDTLKNVIRFIVLCKGIPFRIQITPYHSGSCNQNVLVDALLYYLGENIDDPYSLLDYLNEECVSGGQCHGTYNIVNPYYNADPTFSMDHQFIPNYYSSYNSHLERDVTLSYLITHLDAPGLDIVKNMIDSSMAAINSSGYDWFIDRDPTPCAGAGNILDPYNTRDVFNYLGITNYFIEFSETPLINHPFNVPVMSYSSNGVHTTLGPNPPYPEPCDLYFEESYIQTQLLFTYIAGSVFNTAESFNVSTLGIDPLIDPSVRLAHQGQIPEFFIEGGTVGVGQTYHGWSGGEIVNNKIMLPTYAMGYSFIEAAYMGMRNLADNRVVVGDPLTRIAYPCEPLVLTTNTTISSGDYDCDIVVPEGITLTIAASSVVNFTPNAELKVYGTLNIESGAQLNFNGYSQLTMESNGTITQGSGTSLVFNDVSKFLIDSYLEITAANAIVFNDESEFKVDGTLNLNPGTTIYFNNDSRLRIYGSFISIGVPLNKVQLNFSNSIQTQFYCIDGVRLEIDNTIINNCGIVFALSSGQLTPEYLSITNTTFNNPFTRAAIILTLRGASVQTTPLISNCTFNNCTKGAITLYQVPEITIVHNSIFLGSNAKGISLGNSGKVDISDCIFIGGTKGISTPTHHDDEIEIIEDLFMDIDISQCNFESETGIELNGQRYSFNSVDINGNNFFECEYGIVMNNTVDFIPFISNNVISGNADGSSLYGIMYTNGNEGLASNNSISNYLIGIYLGTFTNPSIVDNSISAVDLTIQPGPGIFMESSNGIIRNNSISGYSNGIELGNSSADIGGNTITNNLYHGIYVGSGSLPNMIGELAGSPPLYYPISGYNDIYDNGGWDDPLGPNDNDGSEIYINNANVLMREGCNSIVDDRIPGGDLINTQLLMNGIGFGTPIEVRVEYNFWGNHPVYPLSTRFGSLIAYFDPYYSIPCPLPEGASGGGSELLITASNGLIIDTIYSVDKEFGELSQTELLYASAEEKFLDLDYENAEIIYNQIINSSDTLFAKLDAYQMLYNLGKLADKNSSYFADLNSEYTSLSQNTSDSLLKKMFVQLASLSLVGQTEYIPAISKFDAIVQQNPGTEEAVYAEIDALTTALLLPPDSTLRKGRLGKYVVGDISDYTNRVNQLLKNRGRMGTDTEKENIPDEYYLYQNYPNPFNPVTTIKYDIPKPGNIELIIYDILGRKVTTLINEQKQPGRFEVKWDASNVASGIYIYQVRVNDFVDSKKMILLK